MFKYVYKKKVLILFAILLDAVGYTLFLPLRCFRKKFDPRTVGRTLIIRADHIGDVVNATCLIKPAREAFPGAHIDLTVSPEAFDLVKDNPSLDGVVVFDAPWFSRKKQGMIAGVKSFFFMLGVVKKYDLVMDLRGDMRHIFAMFLAGVRYRAGYGVTGGGFFLTHEVPYEGVRHEIDRNMDVLRMFRGGTGNGVPDLYFPESDRAVAERLKKEAGLNGPYAVVHPFPGHSAKVWSPEKFAETVRRISSDKKIVAVFIGSSGDRAKVDELIGLSRTECVNRAGSTPFGVLYYLLKGARFFLGVDSGPAHIASVAGTPSVILFSGINDPDQWAPRGENVHLVYPGRGKDLSGVGVEEVVKIIEVTLKSA